MGGSHQERVWTDLLGKLEQVTLLLGTHDFLICKNKNNTTCHTFSQGPSERAHVKCLASFCYVLLWAFCCFKFDLRERVIQRERGRQRAIFHLLVHSPKGCRSHGLSQDPSAWAIICCFAGMSSRSLMRSRAAEAPTSAPLQDAGVPSVSLTHCTTAVYIESELFTCYYFHIYYSCHICYHFFKNIFIFELDL